MKANMPKEHLMWTIVLSIFLVLFGISSFLLLVMNDMTKHTQYASAMSWLNAAIRESLDDYYDDNGRYPGDLSVLSIPFPGDNAKPDMLKEFAYKTDGTYYIIEWTEKGYGEVTKHKEHAIDGKLVSQ